MCVCVCVCVCVVISFCLSPFRCMWYLMWCRYVWHQFDRSVTTWTCLALLFPCSQRTQRQTENREAMSIYIHTCALLYIVFIVQDGCFHSPCSWRCLDSILRYFGYRHAYRRSPITGLLMWRDQLSSYQLRMRTSWGA